LNHVPLQMTDAHSRPVSDDICDTTKQLRQLTTPNTGYLLSLMLILELPVVGIIKSVTQTNAYTSAQTNFLATPLERATTPHNEMLQYKACDYTVSSA